MGLPLDGVRVLDVASYIAAPVASTVMADFGADVIKIEPPAGDLYRALNTNPGLPESAVDFHWQAANRNKRGVTLDLRNTAGRALLDRMIEGADVLVTNFPAGSRTRLRLDWNDLQPVNPRLIYASLSAYGEAGAEAPNPGFDSTAYWARSGLMHMVRPDPDGGPARSMPGQGDHPSGIALFGAIMLALFERERTGVGAHVHTSLLANGIWANAYAAQAALSGAAMPMRPVREAMPNALTNHYQTADGRWFILAVLNQTRDWPRLLAVIHRTTLAADPRFATPAARATNAAALCAVLDEVFAEHSLAVWRARLDEAGLVVGVVGTNEEIPGDPQMVASGALRAAPPGVGASHMVDTPMFVEGMDKRPVHPAPKLGEHTEAVLAEFGVDAETVVEARRNGAFGQTPTSSG